MKTNARLALFALSTLIVAAGVAATAAGGTDPISGGNFIVEIEGLDQCPVAQVDGLATETDVIEYRAGLDFVIRKVPGRHRVGNIVLRRAVTLDTSWWEWRKAIINGEPDRRDVRIRVTDASRSEVVLVVVATRAWPAGYRIAPLDATDSHVLYEELELAVEAIERDE